MLSGLITAVPASVSAVTEGIFTYTVVGREATITDCDTSASGDIIIPSTLGGCWVTSIGNYSFYNCTSLTDVYYSGSKSDREKILINSNNL